MSSIAKVDSRTAVRGPSETWIVRKHVLAKFEINPEPLQKHAELTDIAIRGLL